LERELASVDPRVIVTALREAGKLAQREAARDLSRVSVARRARPSVDRMSKACATPSR
jgi:hypothetical protein